MGIKYEPLSDPPPPSLKYVSGAPGVTVRATGHKLPFPGFYEHDAQLLS